MKNEQELIGELALDIKNLEVRPGIYFLYDNEKLVYIGQAANITRRIIEHICEGVKVFNKVRYSLVPQESLNSVETTLIKALQPEYNIARKSVTNTTKIGKPSGINMRPIAFSHHMRKSGVIPVRIRVCYSRRSFYLPTNIVAYPEDIQDTYIINETILKDLKPILKKYINAVKYLSNDKSFEYVRTKLYSIK